MQICPFEIIVLLLPVDKQPEAGVCILFAPIIELEVPSTTNLLLPVFDITVFRQLPPPPLKFVLEIKVLHSDVSKVSNDDAVIPRLFEHPNAILPEFTAAPIVESHLQNTSLEVQSQTSTLDIESELLAVAILSFGT